MASKLPVLYAPLFSGELDTNDDDVELARLFVRKADALIEHGEEFAEYLPARRCRDNCRYFEPGVAAMCSYWQGAVKADGSDFCSKWEESTP